MSSEDDDVPVAQLAAAASGTSDSEVDWIKDWKPTVAAGGSSPAEGTSTSDSEGHGGVDEDRPIGSYVRPAADSESEGVSSDAASEPKAKRKKVVGVPSVVPLTLLGKAPAKGAKLKTSNLLLQLEDQEFDLSGDTGAVGRYSATRKKVELDMKGVTYAGSMVKCHTLCTVLVTDGKAEIKEVFGNFVHLTKTSDVRDKEEIDGDLDNFDDFEISGDEGVDEGGGAKGGRKKGAKGRKSATKNTATKVPLPDALPAARAKSHPVRTCWQLTVRVWTENLWASRGEEENHEEVSCARSCLPARGKTRL
jgi:hypothetical protein